MRRKKEGRIQSTTTRPGIHIAKVLERFGPHLVFFCQMVCNQGEKHYGGIKRSPYSKKNKGQKRNQIPGDGLIGQMICDFIDLVFFKPH
jgi:hypothetical protein